MKDLFSLLCLNFELDKQFIPFLTIFRQLYFTYKESDLPDKEKVERLKFILLSSGITNDSLQKMETDYKALNEKINDILNKEIKEVHK